MAGLLFSQGEEVGFVQLRDLLQKAGLHDLEREATTCSPPRPFQNPPFLRQKLRAVLAATSVTLQAG